MRVRTAPQPRAFQGRRGRVREMIGRPAGKKVLHVTQSTGGGVETSVLLLLRHLDARRHELHLACPPGTTLASAARALGVRVFEIDMVRNPNPVRDLWALSRLVRLMRREGYALVHAHSAKAGYLGRLAARLAGSSRTVYSPQAFSYLSQRVAARALFSALERMAVPLTDVLVASSQSELRRAVDEVGFDPRRVVVIPNAIDLAEGCAGNPSVAPADPVVLTAGRMAYQKNPEMFIRVARLVVERRPAVRFVFNGGGFASPLEAVVRRQIARFGLERKIEIVPWTDRQATLRLIAECSVFVLTSRFEGLPFVLLEAMMLRKPVVVTDVDGSRDAVDAGRSGYVVRSDDDQAMAERIITILDDPALADRLASCGREIVAERYDIKRNIAEIEGLYDRLLDGGEATGGVGLTVDRAPVAGCADERTPEV